MKAPMSKQASQLYGLGPFRIAPRECLLQRDSHSLQGPLRTLLVLVRNAGHLMLKEELMRSICPDRYIEEVNLSQNISMLRKAPGDQAQGSRYISTVPGRGYRFKEKVRLVPESNEIVLRSSSITQVVIDEHSLSGMIKDLRPARADCTALGGSVFCASPSTLGHLGDARKPTEKQKIRRRSKEVRELI
jgi:DNA-binding winged helix-turn-helix (wHTH) protein